MQIEFNITPNTTHTIKTQCTKQKTQHKHTQQRNCLRMHTEKAEQFGITILGFMTLTSEDASFKLF